MKTTYRILKKKELNTIIACNIIIIVLSINWTCPEKDNVNKGIKHKIHTFKVHTNYSTN